MFTLLRKLFSPIKAKVFYFFSKKERKKNSNFTRYYDYYEINGRSMKNYDGEKKLIIARQQLSYYQTSDWQ